MSGPSWAQDIVRFRRRLAQLLPLEGSDFGDVALDDESLQSHRRFHGRSPLLDFALGQQKVPLPIFDQPQIALPNRG